MVGFEYGKILSLTGPASSDRDQKEKVSFEKEEGVFEEKDVFEKEDSRQKEVIEYPGQDLNLQYLTARGPEPRVSTSSTTRAHGKCCEEA